MRGTKAKQLRRQVYQRPLTYRFRTYEWLSHEDSAGRMRTSLSAGQLRRLYQYCKEK